MRPITIDKIIKQIESLDDSSKLQLLEKLAGIIRESDRNKYSSITHLKGLGTEIWKNVNVDKYIETERRSY